MYQLGFNQVAGLPAKTLKSCRSSLRNAQATSALDFNIHHRPWTPSKILPSAACAQQGKFT